ncbi:MAG: hypothetical protein IT311_09205 [Anaerolineales bacterium]|nr:hypothetical protein [Anaerolineales bacterium]MCZ2121017.1 hypothetical protein [Anaerolineales bacterium]
MLLCLHLGDGAFELFAGRLQLPTGLADRLRKMTNIRPLLESGYGRSAFVINGLHNGFTEANGLD